MSGAIYSDHEHPIIGLFFTDVESLAAVPPAKTASGTPVQTAEDPTFGYGEMCMLRKEQGYNSGMGLIFHLVAGVSPIPNSPALPMPAAGPGLTAALTEQVETAPDVR